MSDEAVLNTKPITPPAQSLYTPFNIVAGLILIVGIIVTILRFTGGLSAVRARRYTS